MHSDYLWFAGVLTAGVGAVMVAAFLVYRRGLAIRLALLSVGCNALVGGLCFFLGREGFTVGNIALAAAIGGPVVLALVVLVIRQVINPVRQLTNQAQALSRGQLALTCDLKAKDEMAQMAAAFCELAAYLRELAAQAGRLAQGDLTAEVTARSAEDALGLAFHTMIANLRVLVQQVSDSADNMSKAAGRITEMAGQTRDAAGQMAGQLQDVAAGAAQQTAGMGQAAQSVGQVSRGIEAVAAGARDQAGAVERAVGISAQITHGMAEVADNAQAGARGSTSAAQAARAGVTTIGSSLQSMQRIKAATERAKDRVREMGGRSAQIGGIVETIDDIARQTSLLALNAAIEAARAGEHGRGFAVVAAEVRKLSERSAQATGEISGLIQDIQHTVAEAVAAMDEGAAEVAAGALSADEAGQALTTIGTAVEAVSGQAQAIATAAQGMRTLTGDLDQAMRTVSEVGTANSASAAQMAADAGHVAQTVDQAAEVSRANRALTDQMSASAAAMSARMEEMAAATQTLTDLAGVIQQRVFKFNLTRISGKVSRGNALLGRLKFVEERYSRADLERVLRALKPEAQRVLRGTLRPEGEYPPELLGELTGAIRQVLAGGSDDILREMTRYRARFDVLPGGALAQHFRPNDPGYTIRRMDLCLRHNWGEGVIVRTFELGGNHIRQEVDMGGKQPRERCTYNHVGWMEGVIEAAGGVPHIRKTRCMHTGDPVCEYDIRWEAPARTPAADKTPALAR
ncbi:MAG: HAMP domain-containing protein [Anaerolineales bacterium]|nr:HAMP domain-containing protein [Anaerolineales bacterium]